jgi:DNA repair photolyase
MALPEKLPETYNSGIRFSSDSMDCAIPVSIDSRNFCRYRCCYCFSENLSRNTDRTPAVKNRKELSIRRLEKFLNRELKDRVSLSMYGLLDSGCPVQLGALGDSFDETELHTGWIKRVIPLFIKYKVPVRIGTKGGRVLQRPEYLRLFENSPSQFWFAFSLICNDDNLLSQIDIGAPSATERIAAMKAVTSIGCKASLRLRPFLPGVSDTYPGGPENAWEILIERCHEAGSRAISFEYIFLPAAPTKQQKVMYKHMYKVMSDPYFGEKWHAISNAKESCRRGDRLYKYLMTMKIREKVLGLGWTFGISDPHFKELNSTLSCCGFPDTGDKWFSNFSRSNMTSLLVEAKRLHDAGTPRLWTYNDWKPRWGESVNIGECVNLGGWDPHTRKKYQTISDSFRNKWNNPEHPRGPKIYFGGVLEDVDIDPASLDLRYKYRPWKF